eukprot:7379710-Prymnesium_polylepis.2
MHRCRVEPAATCAPAASPSLSGVATARASTPFKARVVTSLRGGPLCGWLTSTACVPRAPPRRHRGTLRQPRQRPPPPRFGSAVRVRSGRLPNRLGCVHRLRIRNAQVPGAPE